MKNVLIAIAAVALIASPAFAVPVSPLSLKKATNEEAKLDVRIPIVQANIVAETAKGKTAVVVKLTNKLTKLQAEEAAINAVYPGL